jgi:hypothetical protein
MSAHRVDFTRALRAETPWATPGRVSRLPPEFIRRRRRLRDESSSAVVTTQLPGPDSSRNRSVSCVVLLLPVSSPAAEKGGVATTGRRVGVPTRPAPAWRGE